jgi:hypothetical protein
MLKLDLRAILKKKESIMRNYCLRMGTLAWIAAPTPVHASAPRAFSSGVMAKDYSEEASR